MGVFLSLFLTIIVSIVMFFVGKKAFPHFFKKKDLEFIDTISAYFSLIGAGAFLRVVSPEFSSIKLLLLWMMAGAAIFWMEEGKFSLKKKLLFQLFLSLGSVLTFSDLTFSPDLLWKVPGLVLMFEGFWHIFVWFNRFPSVSFINVLSWILALLGMGLLIQTVPDFIIGPVVFLGVTEFILMRFNLSRGLPCFNPKEALLFGFLWGSLFTYFISSGAIVQTFCFWGYYLFEGIFLGIALVYRRSLVPFLSHLIEQSKWASKAVGFVFSHMLILSFFGAMTLRLRGAASGAIIFVLVIVLIDLFLRLHNLEYPSPTCWEIFSDLKKAVISTTSQVKQVLLLKKEPIPKKVSKKRTPRKRKTKK